MGLVVWAVVTMARGPRRDRLAMKRGYGMVGGKVGVRLRMRMEE